MRKLFLSQQDLKASIPQTPFVLFKIGLSLCVVIQAIGNLLDAHFIFSDNGLFPDSLAKSYFPHLIIPFGHGWGSFYCGILIVLAILTFFRRSQNISFAIIAVIEFILLQRNFAFINKGDFSLVFLTALAALSPAGTWPKRKQSISLAALGPLLFLNFIVYFLNFFAKLTSNWGEGTGLQQTLAHVEMSRFSFSFLSADSISALNYAAILIIFTVSLTPLISLEHRRLKNSLVLLGIIYHLCANIFLRLSWLSLPFLFFQLVLWVPAGKGQAQPLSPRAKYSAAFAYALLLFAFLGMTDADEFYALNQGFNQLGHNWYMFAPAPSMTGHWEVVQKTEQQTERIQLADYKKAITDQSQSAALSFAVYQHEYKYLYNLRRTELIPAVARLTEILCAQASEKTESLQMIYEAHLFRTNEDIEIKYAEKKCHDQIESPKKAAPQKE